MKEIQLAHGGGGEEMNELLQGLFKVIDNEILRDANDAAIVEFSQNEALNFSQNSENLALNSTQDEALNLAQNAEFLGENSRIYAQIQNRKTAKFKRKFTKKCEFFLMKSDKACYCEAILKNKIDKALNF